MAAGETWTALGLAALVVSNIGIWLDKIAAIKRVNGTARKMDEVKKDTEKIDGQVATMVTDVALIKQSQASFLQNCAKTHEVLDRRLEVDEQRLIDLIAKEGE
jgi:hypothetical protein